MDQPIKSSPRDVFMYLFATIALYFSAWSVINLLLQYISTAFPDPLNVGYDAAGSVRWSMALLIIIFPAYLWVSRFLHRDLVASPEKGEIRIRRWLLYLTLFLAALLIIGDLVALINNFLNGELTMRFFLKVIAVLAVAGGIFWYYLYDLRAKAVAFGAAARLFVRAVVAAVIIIIVAGFFIAGSPFRQRLVRFDDQKVADLQNIQYQIVNQYWMQKGTLPKTLDDLRDSISGYAPPFDPQSGTAYEYRSTGMLTFELCAQFNVSSVENKNLGISRPMAPYGVPGSMDTWSHGVGRQCFPRTIDPQIYKPQTVPTKPIPVR